jgi:hypothetical protein
MANIGYTTIGGTPVSLAGALSTGNITNTYTAGSGDTVTSVQVYAALTVSGSSTQDVGIYTFSGGLPVTLIGTGKVTINSTTPQWWSANTSIALTNGTTYTVAIGNQVGTATNVYRDAVGNYSLDLVDGAGPLPTTWHSLSTSAFSYSYYAVVGPAAVGGWNVALV